MKYIKLIIAAAFASLCVLACTEEEPLTIQGVDAKVDGKYVHADKQSEEYYASIRAFKKSDHIMSFGFYTAWHALEGSNGEVPAPASWGQRLRGLPDSLDIADLWMGIPSNDPEDPEYSPVTWADMKFCQEKLGTRFVSHEDASHNQVFEFDGKYYNVLSGKGTSADGHGSSEADPIGGGKASGAACQEACEAYARAMVKRMINGGLDGVDIDYEPNDATWSGTTRILFVLKELNKYIGPESKGYTLAEYPDKDTTKLCMLNFFGAAPDGTVEPFLDYVVNQCYAWQIGTNVTGWLGRRPNWCPKKKFILNDSIGGEAKEAYLYGGKPCEYKGQKMYSMEAMARLCKDEGLCGFGAYYLDRNYMSLSGIPYREFRRDICIANGADMEPYYVNE